MEGYQNFIWLAMKQPQYLATEISKLGPFEMIMEVLLITGFQRCAGG